MRSDRIVTIYFALCSYSMSQSNWDLYWLAAKLFLTFQQKNNFWHFTKREFKAINTSKRQEKTCSSVLCSALLSQPVMSHRAQSSWEWAEWQHAVHTTSTCFSNFVLRSKCTGCSERLQYSEAKNNNIIPFSVVHWMVLLGE